MAHPGGRPLKFPTPEDLLASWEAYKLRKSEKQDLICKDNFCVETGNYPGLFSEYAKKPEFSKALSQIETDCKYYLTNKAVKGEYNAVISKVLLSANYGIREKQEVEHSGSGITVNISKEDSKL